MSEDGDTKRNRDELLEQIARRPELLLQIMNQARSAEKALRKSESFRLGNALIKAVRSWQGLRALPSSLLDIHRSHKEEYSSAFVSHPAGTSVDRKFHANGYPRIAAIMDRFTHDAFAPDCDLIPLRPGAWKEQIRYGNPDLLFIETAWFGINGSWQDALRGPSREIEEIVAFTRKKGIPSVLWNKEDPVHYAEFFELARLVDYVFTTDLDCIPLYVLELGHDRVFPLPFAAQPALHNPLEKYKREPACCFAGSYYAGHSERCRDIDWMFSAIEKVMPVVIYDRNANSKDKDLWFPDKFRRSVAGSLPYSDIDRAYKGYRWGLNINTIKRSPTMMARRVFELAASNTPIVSNRSKGMRNLFGNLIVSGDCGEELIEGLRSYSNELKYRKLRLANLRNIMQHHTYQHRMDHILTCLGANPDKHAAPVWILAVPSSEEETEVVLKSFARQAYPLKRLLLVTADSFRHRLEDNIILVTRDISTAENILKTADKEALFGVFCGTDYYGENYLVDLALSFQYNRQSVASGKHCRYAWENSVPILENDGFQYKPVNTLLARSAVAKLSRINTDTLHQCLSFPMDAIFSGQCMASDEFNYIMNSMHPDEKSKLLVNDIPDLRSGCEMNPDKL